MARKIKNDNTNSLFWFDKNGDIEYTNVNEGVRNVSSDRPKLDRNQRNELAGSNEPNLGFHSVRTEGQHTNANEGNLFGNDEVFGNADGRNRRERDGRSTDIFSNTDIQNSGNAELSQRRNSKEEQSSQSNRNNEERNSELHSQLQSDTHNGKRNDTSLFDEPTDRPVDSQTASRNSTIHRPITNENVDELRQASDTGRLHELDIPTTNSTSLGGTTGEYGNDRRYSEANLFDERNDVGETGTRNTISSDVGIRSTSEPTSERTQGNGEYGFGDISNSRDGHLQSISANATNSISDERNQSQSVSLLNENGTDSNVGSAILKKINSVDELKFIKQSEQNKIIEKFYDDFNEKINEAVSKTYLKNYDKNEFCSDIHRVTNKISNLAIKNDDGLPEIVRQLDNNVGKRYSNDGFDYIVKSLDDETYKNLQNLVVDISIAKFGNTTTWKDFTNKASDFIYEEALQHQLNSFNYAVEAFNQGIRNKSDIIDKVRELERNEYKEILEKLYQTGELEPLRNEIGHIEADKYDIFIKLLENKEVDEFLSNKTFRKTEIPLNAKIFSQGSDESDKNNELIFNIGSNLRAYARYENQSKDLIRTDFNSMEDIQLFLDIRKMEVQYFIDEYKYFFRQKERSQTNEIEKTKTADILNELPQKTRQNGEQYERINQNILFEKISEFMENYKDENGKIDLYGNYKTIFSNEHIQNELSKHTIEIRGEKDIPANARVFGKGDKEYTFGDTLTENQMYRIEFSAHGFTRNVLALDKNTKTFLETQRGILAQLIADYEKDRKYKEKSTDIDETSKEKQNISENKIEQGLFPENEIEQARAKNNESEIKTNEIKKVEDIDTSNFKIFSTGINVDFVADENIDTAKIGKKEKFRNNIEAIKLAKELYEIKQKALKEQKNFTIAKEEQQILSKFSGWGGISEAFDIRNENWTNEYNELKEVLSDKNEYDEARASTTTAFYTPKLIIDTMYNALDQMGVNNDENAKKILEPSAGNGAFLAHAKNHLKGEYEFNVAEIEPNSNKFLNLLHPNSKVFSNKLGFQDISISGQTQYDLVIGNPPYDNFRIYDKYNPDISGMSVHNYFTAKSLKHLKDKGIMAFVVTHNFLDSKNSEVRENITKEATFLGAVRLPNTAFKDEAKTEVVTDIVFFQKGINQEIAHKNASWSSVSKFGDFPQGEFFINSYFKDNPQNVLGNLQVQSSQFGYELTCIENQNIDLKTALDNFVKNELPKNIYEYTQGKTLDENLFAISKFNENYQAKSKYYDNLKESNFLIFDNEIYQKQNSLSDDEAIFKKVSVGKTDEKKIRNFITIRDLREELLKLEATDIADDTLKLINKRLELKNAYDKYHKDGYFLSDSKTNKILRDSLNGDPDFYKVSSLEKNFKKGISKNKATQLGIEQTKSSCEEADILLKRVVRPTPIFEFDNAKDGLFVSINKFGKVDTDFIAEKLNKEAYEIENELLDQKLIFLDPALFQKGEKEFIFAPKYLSGNVRAKLKIAEEVAKDEPRFSHNILALKEIVPKDIQAHDITVNIGAGWIPQKYYKEFFMKEFNIDESKFSLSYSEKTGIWNIGGNDWYMNYSIKEKFSYTHPENRAKNKSAYDIAGYALSGTSPRIMKDSDEPLLNNDGSMKIDSNGNIIYKQILDVVATQEVQRKVNIIKNDFEEWIFKDYARRKDLQDIYNDKFNCYVRKNYDGETFKFEGINEAFKLRKHQKDAVVRAINDKVVLLDHEVGAGKTLTAICSIMEQKKLGVVNKPLVVVPNHLVKQWQSEFMNAYPNANILVADENSMSKDKRDEFLAKITNGNFDAVIMKFTQFERIPVPIEIEKKVLSEQIFELEEAIRLREEDENFSGRRYSVKRLESAKEKLEQKLKNAIEKAEKTKMIDFSELGVDYLIVDESHSFKNLQFSTMLDNVKGLGNPQGSNRAIDIFMKTTYMHEQEKAKIMFLTGTPVSNSLVELYLVQKYLSPNELANNGLSSFDGWAKTFGNIEQVFEAGVIPNDYKVANRFTSFENLQTLGMQYLDFADIITNAEIKKYNGNFVPEAEIVITQSTKSDKVAEYIGIENEYGTYNEGSIIWRLENMPSDPREDNHLKITNDAKKAGLDYRLIDPNAEDNPNSKINKAVENIFKEYEAWNSDKGTQLVFLDIGTPKSNSQLSKNIDLSNLDNSNNKTELSLQENDFVNINEILQKDEIKDDFKDDEIISERDANEKTFFLYGDIYKKLVEKGIPREQIAFIHDANTNNEKQELFDKVNSGEIRVLIGSTSKMGAGTNIQERVTAIHHIDCPWKPSDLTQRNGRVIRQGNKLFERDPQNFKVKDYRYVTTGTYDEASWQIVTSKAKAILNFRTGVLEGNSLDGFEDEVVNSELLKASANEEPLYLLQHKIKNALDELEREQKSFTQNRNTQENELASSQSLVNYYAKNIEILKQTKEHVAKFPSDDTTRISVIQNNADRTEILHKFEIQNNAKDETKLAQSEMKSMLLNNFDLVLKTPNRDFNVCEYKGFIVSGYYDQPTSSVIFELKNKENGEILSPKNLVYESKEKGLLEVSNLKNQISVEGFLIRLNNYFKGLDKNIDEYSENLSKNNSKIEALKHALSTSSEFPKTKMIKALKDDLNACFAELGKRKEDKSYKSSFDSEALKLFDESKKAKKHNFDDNGGIKNSNNDIKIIKPIKNENNNAVGFD